MKLLLRSTFRCLVSLLTSSRLVAEPLDTNRIDQITGLKGAWNAAEGVFKVSQPRSEVPVKVDEWRMPPFMGLTSWAAFLAGKKSEAMVMGDLVLFQDEVVFGRVARMDCGCDVGKEMGVNTWASFAGSDENSPGFSDQVAGFDKAKPVLVNCHVGSRGAIASAALGKLGFKSVYNLEDGLDGWEKAGHHPETNK